MANNTHRYSLVVKWWIKYWEGPKEEVQSIWATWKFWKLESRTLLNCLVWRWGYTIVCHVLDWKNCTTCTMCKMKAISRRFFQIQSARGQLGRKESEAMCDGEPDWRARHNGCMHGSIQPWECYKETLCHKHDTIVPDGEFAFIFGQPPWDCDLHNEMGSHMT